MTHEALPAAAGVPPPTTDASRVRVAARETAITLTTNVVGPSGWGPVLVSEGRQSMYPYTRRDHLFDDTERRPWRALEIENEYLRATVLPELGGRLFSLYDKVSGREVFTSPRRFRFGRIHLRGAWAPVGVELNFPKGHTVASTVPVTCLLHRHADGSASVVSGATDLVTGMRWEVWFTLRPGVGRLLVHNRFSNPTALPHGAMYWHNASVWVSDGFRFQSRANMAYVLEEIGPFPWRNGLDYAWYRNRHWPMDLFLVGVPEDWFGYYNHDTEFGALHLADRRLMPGKKFFSWGNAEDGLIWSRTFGLDGRHYGELQAGLMETQSERIRFEPGQQIECDECWYPIPGLGDVLQADERVAIGFRPAKADTPPQLTLVVTEDLGDLAVTCADLGTGAVLAEAAVTPRPLAVVRLPMSAAPGTGGVRLCVARGDRVLLERDVPPLTEPTEAEIEAARVRIHPRHDDSPAGLVEQAIHAHNWQYFSRARQLLARALAADPNLPAAHRELGWLALRACELDAARGHFEDALRLDPDDAWSHYGLGEALRQRGIPALAAGHLERAAEAPATAVPGGLAYACLLTNGRRLAEAEALLRRLADAHPTLPDVWFALAAALPPERRDDAMAALRQGIELSPTHPLSLALPVLTEHPGAEHRPNLDRLVKASGDTAGLILEATSILIEMGADGSALNLIECALDDDRLESSVPFLAGYVAAHRASLHDDQERMADWYEDMFSPEMARDWDWADPSRPVEVRALRWAAARVPSDPWPHLMLGNFYASRGREADALREWHRTLAELPEEGIAHRNIGFTLFRHRRDLPEALEHYQAALVAYPDNIFFHLEAARLLALMERPEERLALLERVPADLKRGDLWIMEYAVALQDAGRPREALEAMMAGPDLIPWEGERRMRQSWVECHLALGRQALAQDDLDAAEHHFNETLRYPPNLLFGEPFHTERSIGLYHLALAAEARGDTAKARDLRETAAGEERSASARRRFRAAEAYYYSALSAIHLGRPEQAEEILGRTAQAWNRMKDRPIEPLDERFGFDAYREPFAVGLALKALGRFDEAEEAFRRARQMYGPQAELIWHLATLRLFGLEAIRRSSEGNRGTA